MANGDDITAGQPPVPDMGGSPVGGGSPGGGGPPPGGPPQMSGSPVLAALTRHQMGPQVSAPGMGNIAKGLMQLKMCVDLLQQALPNLPSGGQQHKDCLRALNSLSKHIPQGIPTAGVQQTQIGDMLRQTVRNQLMQRMMGSQGAGGQPGGQPAPPQAATPLPGA